MTAIVQHSSPHRKAAQTVSGHGGQTKRDIFGEVKANCTKQTSEPGLGTQERHDSSCLQTGLIPTTVTVNTQNTRQDLTEKNAPFFSQFTPKNFSSAAFRGQKQGPEAPVKDRDAGSLTQASMLTDTDSGGPV